MTTRDTTVDANLLQRTRGRTEEQIAAVRDVEDARASIRSERRIIAARLTAARLAFEDFRKQVEDIDARLRDLSAPLDDFVRQQSGALARSEREEAARHYRLEAAKAEREDVTIIILDEYLQKLASLRAETARSRLLRSVGALGSPSEITRRARRIVEELPESPKYRGE
ncbi:hypothetical protein V1504DRAFT_430747 [Lipomyces starkeyi]